MLVEDIAMEVYSICRERLNNTKKCLELIAKEIILDQEAIKDTILEDKIRRYRESCRGLEDLAKYVQEKYIDARWKI